MSFIIDTSVLIEIEKVNKYVLSKLAEFDFIKEDAYITSPTYTEFCFGLLKISKEKLRLEKSRLDKYKLLNTTENSSMILAEMKDYLLKKGVMIPIFDIFIASIAVDNKLPLVTLDNDFKKIPELNTILIE